MPQEVCQEFTQDPATGPEDEGLGPSEENRCLSKPGSAQQHACSDPFLGGWLQPTSGWADNIVSRVLASKART